MLAPLSSATLAIGFGGSINIKQLTPELDDELGSVLMISGAEPTELPEEEVDPHPEQVKQPPLPLEVKAGDTPLPDPLPDPPGLR